MLKTGTRGGGGGAGAFGFLTTTGGGAGLVGGLVTTGLAGGSGGGVGLVGGCCFSAACTDAIEGIAVAVTPGIGTMVTAAAETGAPGERTDEPAGAGARTGAQDDVVEADYEIVDDKK